MFKAVVFGALGLAVVAAIGVEAGSGKTAGPGGAVASMHDSQGGLLGKVWFLPRAGGKVAVRAATSFLPAGFHGFHVHAVGKCEAPFTSAGGHHNPSSTGHGSHAGDLPVLFVGKGGSAGVEFQTDAFAIEQLLDGDGSAVIVHAGPDNYANIPARYSSTGSDAGTLATGDAGGRIACGVVEKRAA